MQSVLFICHGNICRSPMAEFLFRDLLLRNGLDGEVSVASAGTSREELGNPVYPPAARLLRAAGIDPSGKTARQLRPSDASEFHYLITMDSANLRNTKRVFPHIPSERLFRLLDLCEQPRDIADPWYSGDFQKTWDDLQEGCTALWKHLALG